MLTVRRASPEACDTSVSHATNTGKPSWMRLGVVSDEPVSVLSDTRRMPMITGPSVLGARCRPS